MGRDRADVCCAHSKNLTPPLVSRSPSAAPRSAKSPAAGCASTSALTTFANLVAPRYYRDDRVMRSLGLASRPPYPKGYEVERATG
jgi:hypothetical protein